MAIDQRGTIEKVTAGDFGSLDVGDVAGAAQMASGQLMGMAGKAMPLVGAASTALTGVTSVIGNDKAAAALAEQFASRNIKQLKRRNPALRKQIEKMEDSWQGDMVDATISTGAGIAGGALLGALFPPFGPLIGSVVGGYIGHKIYSSALADQAQDPVVMNAQLIKMSEDGQGVPVEAVFATLAANVSGKQGKVIDKLLKKYTGKELFSEALADPKNMAKLQAMMSNPVVDDAIRAQTGMPRDAMNPMKSVAEQYTELLNSGKMQARNILNTGEGMYVLAAAERGQQYNVDVPVTPEIRNHSRERNA